MPVNRLAHQREVCTYHAQRAAIGHHSDDFSVVVLLIGSGCAKPEGAQRRAARAGLGRKRQTHHGALARVYTRNGPQTTGGVEGARNNRRRHNLKAGQRGQCGRHTHIGGGVQRAQRACRGIGHDQGHNEGLLLARRLRGERGRATQVHARDAHLDCRLSDNLHQPRLNRADRRRGGDVDLVGNGLAAHGLIAYLRQNRSAQTHGGQLPLGELRHRPGYGAGVGIPRHRAHRRAGGRRVNGIHAVVRKLRRQHVSEEHGAFKVRQAAIAQRNHVVNQVTHVGALRVERITDDAEGLDRLEARDRAEKNRDFRAGEIRVARRTAFGSDKRNEAAITANRRRLMRGGGERRDLRHNELLARYGLVGDEDLELARRLCTGVRLGIAAIRGKDDAVAAPVDGGVFGGGGVRRIGLE